MAQARDEAGNIWDVTDPANPVLVRPANAAQGRVFTLPQSPKEQAEEARRSRKDELDAADKARDNDRADEALDIRREAARLDAELKRAQLQKSQGGGDTGKLRDRLSRLNQLVAQINRVQSLYDDSIGTTKGVAGLADYLPLDANARFDAAGAALSQQGLAAFRVPGTGTVSDRDAIMFDRANLPTAATRDAAIEEQLLGLRSRVDAEMAALGQPTPQWVQDTDAGTPDQQNPDELAKAAMVDDTSPPGMPPAGQGGNDPNITPWDGPRADFQTAASGEYRFADNPRARSNIAALINAGAGYATVAAAAKKAGGNLSLGEFNAVKTWMDQNPGKEYPASSVNAGEYVPLNLGQKIAGSPAGAFTAQMANAATAGTVGALAGERGQGALDAMAALNPNSSLAGNIVGGITGAGAAELAVGARLAGTGLRHLAPRLADAGFGAATGFNTAGDGDGLTGALTGAALGAAGGAVGDRVMRGVGRGIRGAAAPAARTLREAGVPLTIGQVMGEGGAFGRGIKKIEDSLTSVPFVGNMVDARRMEGLRGFNQAAFEVGAETTGGQVQDYGAAGINQLRSAVGDAYRRALDPVNIDANENQFIDDLGATIRAAQGIPNVNGAQDAAMAGLEARITGAIDPETEMMSGRGFQEAYRGLARTGRERAGGDYGHEVGQVMRQGQDALAGALERQNPGAYDGFTAANAGNRRMNILADAVGRAKNAEDNLFTPAQLNMADEAAATRLTGKVNASSGNRPFADLANAGQTVLPSKLPDSGTWTRALTGLGLSGGLGAGGYAIGSGEGAATGTGIGLGATLALLAGGSRPAQRAAVAALLDRPEVIRQLGGAIVNARLGGPIGGGMGSAVLTPLTIGSQ